MTGYIITDISSLKNGGYSTIPKVYILDLLVFELEACVGVMENQEEILVEILRKAATVVDAIDEPYRNMAFPVILQWLLNSGGEANPKTTVSHIEKEQGASELRLSPNISVNAFFQKAGPDSHPARFVCAAYYLLHTGKAEQFIQSDILEIYGKLRTPKPKNPTDVMNQCIKKVHIIDGPITPDKQKTWVITPEGEKYVEELLNDNTNSHR